MIIPTITQDELTADVYGYCDRVEKGETFRIVRDGKTVAWIQPPSPKTKPKSGGPARG